MRLLFFVTALILAFSLSAWAVEDSRVATEGESDRQTEYTCNDGDSEGFLYLDVPGEGFGNSFTPTTYPSKIEAVNIALVSYVDSHYGIQYPTCVVHVWADNGGQPGAVLFSQSATLEAPAESGTFAWNSVDISGADVVIESGDFWVGILDDGSLSIECPYDDVDVCGTYYYDPGSGTWMALADIGFPYGMYIGATVGEGVPVELASFEAASSEDGVLLTWQTLSETDCYAFYLTRSASELGSFLMLDGSLISGHGTSSGSNDYSFLDNTTTPGVWFYRLIQLDTDGSETVFGPTRVLFAPSRTGSWGKIKAEFK